MPRYIRLIRFTNAGLDACEKSTATVFEKTLGAIEKAEAKVLTAYASLGSFDVVSVLEARDQAHVEQVDAALAALGYYIIVEQAGAVSLSEFVQLSATSPVFVSAWLQGRRAQPVDRRAPGELPEARAKSPARTRAGDKDERRHQRAPGNGTLNLWAAAVGPLAVDDFSVLSSAEGTVAAAVKLPVDHPLAASLAKLERNASLSGWQFEFVQEKARVPFAAKLRRMDPLDANSFEVVVEGAIPKAAAQKLEQRMSEGAKTTKR